MATRHSLVFLPWISGAAFGQSLPNGVAAGDVDQSSAILWARSTVVGEIVFEYADHSSFTDAETVIAAVADPTVPVKVEIAPLSAATAYYYRVTDADGATAEGIFRTPAAEGYHGLRFGVSGDWRGELRPYPSISNIPEHDLDFFVALGDTIYADVPSLDFPDPQARSLEDFRIKHAEGYSERFGVNSWAEVRASTAIYATIDDHEVTNDFSGGAPPGSDPRFDERGDFLNETELYTNALQAFHEYNPIRDEAYGDTGDPRTSGKPRLYRFRRFGQDAAIMMLDARSFRDEGLREILAPPDPFEFREYQVVSFDSSRTMLGEVQLAELMSDLLFAEEKGITWKFVLVPEPIQNLGPILASDRFEGYAYERTAILSFIEENDIRNVVFIAADVHGTIVNNLVYQRRPGGEQIETSMFEITTGSVAFAAPFGPTTIARAGPVIGGLYSRLDRDGQNNLIRIISNVMLSVYGYPKVGLDWSPIDAQLLDGGYVVVNTYGWTEFEIDADTQQLTVTTYGIAWYSPETMATYPDDIVQRRPSVVSRFRVDPCGDGRGSSPLLTDYFDPCRRSTPCGALGSAPCGALGAINVAALAMTPFLRLMHRRAKIRAEAPIKRD